MSPQQTFIIEVFFILQSDGVPSKHKTTFIQDRRGSSVFLVREPQLQASQIIHQATKVVNIAIWPHVQNRHTV